jgi:hypothetical protein
MWGFFCKNWLKKSLFDSFSLIDLRKEQNMLPNNDESQVKDEEKPGQTKKTKIEPLTLEQLRVLREKYCYQYPDDPSFGKFIQSQVIAEK